ncbi:MAG: nickel-dependent lactate racemase [Desulfobacterales bacterium]
MANVTFPFDGTTCNFAINDKNLAEILSPRPSEILADLDRAVAAALDAPINQDIIANWVKPTDRVMIVSDDNTRLTPVDRMLPPLLDRLNAAGIPDSGIGCIIALGTHRYMTEDELAKKVGPAVFRRIRVHNHEWRNPEALVDLGHSRQGTPLSVNRVVAEANVVIGLGAIVPHHIPGYSGSSKIIQPGVCGAETTAETHLLSCRSGGDSFLGIEDNPVRQDMDDMADMVGMNTIFNVVMDSQGGVVGLFFGEKRAAFKAGARLARDIYGITYHEIPDIVVANSYPCDLDFWQSHKALYPAQRIIRPGGTIIVCTPAPEGVSPVHTDLLSYTSWSSAAIQQGYRSGRIKNGVAAALAAAWAMVREKASVIMYSPGISEQDKKRLGFGHADNIEAAMAEALKQQGSDARTTIFTHAPDMLPLPARELVT